MCGFAGLLRSDGLIDGDTGRVARAAHALVHRGPDSAGFWHDARIALGFRRLKIIDLSAAAEQPMANEDGSLRVVFNGEIYNHKELRAELLARGHVFRSNADTEVLLHLFEDLGEAMLPRLRGMFAFAIWNERDRQLFMARDPAGVKPLYFAERDGALFFGSEIKALFAAGVERRLDAVALDEALAFRYVTAPRSGFKDVEKLPPGHCAWFKDGALEYKRWWRFQPGFDGKANPAECLDRIAAAVTRRLPADVPLGFWLSGGIDSALVLAQSKTNHATFCAGFAQPEYDERALAQLTADHFKTPHHSFEIPAGVFDLLPKIIWHADEPFFDSSALPVYVLAQKTKAHATVALGGDGGDECFAGYDRYAGLQHLARFKKIPRVMRALALAFARWRHPAASRSGWDRMLRWLEKCRLMESSGHHPYIAATELFSAEQRGALYGDAMKDEIDGCDARESLERELLRARKAFEEVERAAKSKPHDWAGAIGTLQLADIETYLPGDVLHKVDRMSMAHGLEIRSPFLDVDLLQWALSLPEDIRNSRSRTKPLLRDAAQHVLPPAIAAARKRGFGVPLDAWFRGPLKQKALDLFENSVCVKEKILAPNYWHQLWAEHQSHQAQHGERLYALYATELWHTTFLSPSTWLDIPMSSKT